MQSSKFSVAVVLLGAMGCSTGGGTRSHRGAPHPLGRDAPRPAEINDADRDGVPDFADKCLGKKETRNGYKDGDGCPDVYPLVFEQKRIRLRQPISFVGENAVLSTAAHQVLTTLATALRKRPKIMLVEIQSHLAPSALGSADYNRRLSLRRAKVVRNFLVRTGGISKLRLDVGGYGAQRPLCPDKTRACRALNERIELRIIWQGGNRHRRTGRAIPSGHRSLLPPRHRSALTRSAALRLRQRRIRKIYEGALRLVRRRQYTAAYGQLHKVVRMQPGNLAARLELGVVQARLGDHTGANQTVRWIRTNIGDDAADRLRKAQLKAMSPRKP
jgi:outer membrane protein OmpA-like peptidoglycan-associated protein